MTMGAADQYVCQANPHTSLHHYHFWWGFDPSERIIAYCGWGEKVSIWAEYAKKVCVLMSGAFGQRYLHKRWFNVLATHCINIADMKHIDSARPGGATLPYKCTACLNRNSNIYGCFFQIRTICLSMFEKGLKYIPKLKQGYMFF